MNKEYIQLCAELAYNNVIMESYLNEELNILNEEFDISSLKEKIKEFINKIKLFIKTLYNKISTFILNKILEIKAKLSKQKVNNESSDINILEGVDYSKVLNEFKNDIVDKLLDIYDKNLEVQRSAMSELNKIYISNSSDKMSQYEKELSNLQEKYEKEFNNVDNSIVIDIQSKFNNIKNKYNINGKDIPASIQILDSCKNSIREYKIQCDKMISTLDEMNDDADETLFNVKKDIKKSSDNKEYIYRYYAKYRFIVSRSSKIFNAISGQLQTTLNILLNSIH